MRRLKKLARGRARALTALATALACLASCSPARPSVTTAESSYRAASAALRVATSVPDPLRGTDGAVTVILSQSDGTHRAYVQIGRGATVDAAWADADAKILAQTRNSALSTKYLKADVVTAADEIPLTDALSILSDSTPPYPFGLALSDDLSVVLLPQELDSLRPFRDGALDLAYLNAYFDATRRPRLETTPETALALSTTSTFLDATAGETLTLGARGVRDVAAHETQARAVVASAGEYLLNHLDARSGEFQYLLYPQSLAESGDYNVVRHAGALYAMTQAADLTGDSDYKARVAAGVAYLESLTRRDGTGAVVMDDETKTSASLGTAGITLLLLENYERAFGSDEHRDLLTAVADAVVARQALDGHVPHVLDANLEPETDFRTVFYDGEACFGLFRAHAATGDERYLDAALRLADYMVANEYWRHRDHWLAYSMREATRVRPERVEYYDLALRNFSENETELSRAAAHAPTRLELLTATLDVYERAVENGVPVPDGFDAATLRRATRDQAVAQLDCYLFPERAMYSAACDEITGAFYDNSTAAWEIRVDTVQHHLSGYYNLIQHPDVWN